MCDTPVSVTCATFLVESGFSGSVFWSLQGSYVKLNSWLEFQKTALIGLCILAYFRASVYSAM